MDAGFTQFLSGMAEATDTWSALSVLNLREKNPAIKLHCILPCKEQADKWSASSRDLYHSILDRADSIVYVSRTYYKNCMLDRNRFLVDHAVALLAVYNGERRGGTAATMRYAQKVGREIIVIDPITRLISHGDIVPGPAHNRAPFFLRGCAEMSDRRKRKSHAVRRVRLAALRPVRGLVEPQQAASEYRKRYSDALLAYD